MAKQINKIIFAGNIGKDPEMRYVPSGKPVTEFPVASHDQYPNAQCPGRNGKDHHLVQVHRLG